MADVFHFRLVLLGSHATGKTSILNRFLFKKFENKYRPTVEDLFCKDFDLGSIEIKVDFLDTSGSMQFPAMRRLSITTGSAFLIVYALDDEESYQVLKRCVEEIREIRADFQEIPIVFAGNKCDLPREQRKVSKETVSNYVHYELPRLRAKVIECSCRDGLNIDNIFRAYLSLAKVSLSVGSTVSSVRGSPRPGSAQLAVSREQPSARCPADRCPSADCSLPQSMKVALGVRKSCDASISLPGRPNQAARNNDQMDDNEQPDAISECQSSSKQVILETAIQSKLSQKAKPRSRSLIWRPSRKAKTNNNNANNNDCRVS